MASRIVLVFNPDIGLPEEQQLGDTARFDGPVDFGAKPAQNLADPSYPQDAATKAYVDARMGGGGGGDVSSGIILGHGPPPDDPAPGLNQLWFDLDTGTVYPAI